MADVPHTWQPGQHNFFRKSRKFAEEIKSENQNTGEKSSKVTKVCKKNICSYQKYHAKPWNSVKLSNMLL